MSRNDPATKGDLKTEINALEERIDIRHQNDISVLLKMIKQEGEKTRQHFDAVGENMFQDIKGANEDQLSLHDEKFTNHDQRIDRLEIASGLV